MSARRSARFFMSLAIMTGCTGLACAAYCPRCAFLRDTVRRTISAKPYPLQPVYHAAACAGGVCGGVCGGVGERVFSYDDLLQVASSERSAGASFRVEVGGEATLRRAPARPAPLPSPLRLQP